MRPTKGSLFVVSAPSGAGKTSLCQRLCETLPGIRHSVSYTTREPRPGEVDGVHYSFVDRSVFTAMAEKGEFLEWAEVHGNCYGTSRRRIEELLQAGVDVVLDIDVQGARQIRQSLQGCLLIFILPPSMETLKERLRGRKSDTEQVIAQRLRNALGEIAEYKKYEYVIINNLFDEALRDLASIVLAERARTAKADHEWVERTFLKEG